MKIAIMTLRPSKNYGGIMQAWALQQFLRNAGCYPVTIDRQIDAQGPIYLTARLGYRILQKVQGKRKGPVNMERHMEAILRDNYNFIQSNICMSEALHSTSDLKSHFDDARYDAIIIGSDQTWRPKYSPNIGNFFLDFLEGNTVKRIAYATSFGVDEWEFTKEQTERFSKLSKEFDAISVREKSGINLCREYFGVDAEHVLDPTLLLRVEHYETLYRDKGAQEGKGIYTYILDKAEWKDKVIAAAKAELKRPVFSSQPKASMHQPDSKRLSDYKMPCVTDWVKGFSDAEFVITDSFHGVVFSIIFNKPFISLINPKRGASRFHSLLGELDLTERLISGYNEEEVMGLLRKDVDYKKVEQKLKLLRERSERFLLEALEPS